MYETSDIRRGLKIELEDDVYVVIEFQHVNPGNWRAFIRTKLKSLSRGNVIERTFRSGEKLGRPDLEEKKMQFLYGSGDQYCFMDQQTYEQMYLTEEHLGDNKSFVKENATISVLLYKGVPIAVDLPTFVELAVVQTDPGARGDTVTGGSKPATLETGAVIQVPLFVNQGDVIKVDTRTGTYVERV
jgi:elongation factor P